MNTSDLKYYIGISAIFLIDSLHVIFFENNDRIDVYLFYDHERYLTNILYDISNLFKFSILTYWLISLNRNIFKPLFILSVALWFSYFIFYNQITSLILIPIYIVSVFLIHNKNIFK